MIAAITYIGKRNDKLGLYPFKRFVSADAIPANIKKLIDESPAFASQFVDGDKFKAFMKAKRTSPPAPLKKMIPGARVPQSPPIARRK